MENGKKTALITGGSSGLGLEFAKLLAGRGINTILASRNEKRLMEAKDLLIKDYKIKVWTIPCDLSKAGEAERLTEECEKLQLHPDILINNAGTGLFGESTELDFPAVKEMLYLNMQSLTVLCSIFGKEMKDRKEGRILNISSLAGNQPTPYFASYAASKSYVTNFSIALNRELKDSGVQVSCLLPGYIATAFDNNAGIKSENYKKFSEKNSMTPAQVAEKGIKILYSGKTAAIAGAINKISAIFSWLFPKTLISSILKSSVSGMIKDIE